MLQDEYYVIERENDDNYPPFSWDQSSGRFGLGKPVKTEDPVKLMLAEPISPNFEWVDFHPLPSPVLSSRIVDVLAPLDIYGIQLVPAIVRNPNDSSDGPYEYWFMHIWNHIQCVDTDKSDIELFDTGEIFAIDELVLDEKVLEPIELKKRQIFALAEKRSVMLVHQTVKDIIASVRPKGCRFFKASEWNSDSSFT